MPSEAVMEAEAALKVAEAAGLATDITSNLRNQNSIGQTAGRWRLRF